MKKSDGVLGGAFAWRVTGLILCIILGLSALQPCYAQDQKPQDKSKYWDAPDPMPRFPGGDKALIQWVSDNLQYPERAREEGIQGRVIVRFLIGADGSVSGAEVQRSLDPDCDAEALRLVGAMPRWTPSTHNGEPVAAYYTMPVWFRLEN